MRRCMAHAQWEEALKGVPHLASFDKKFSLFLNPVIWIFPSRLLL